MSQTQINFNPIGHRENNPESQAYLSANLEKFSDQCKRLYEYMAAGNSVNMKTAINVLDIWHLARRIKDLKDKHGVTIYDKRHERGYKEYKLTPWEED